MSDIAENSILYIFHVLIQGKSVPTYAIFGL